MTRAMTSPRWPVLPPDVLQYEVPRRVIEDSHEFLRARGIERHEGTGLWAGVPVRSGWARITRFIAPEQIAVTTEWGCHVELTPAAHYTLPDLLEGDEQFYVRIHSHPEEAYHSATDDENGVISHRGALSIVVPDFARRPIRLDLCAVYHLVHGQGWLALNAAQIALVFTVVEDTP